MSVAVRFELPPDESADTLLESTATPQWMLTLVPPFRDNTLAPLPVNPVEGLVPSSARMHRSEAVPANWAVALAVAVGAVARNSPANHIGWSWEIVTVKYDVPESQVVVTVVLLTP